jgi:hypothetical protein
VILEKPKGKYPRRKQDQMMGERMVGNGLGTGRAMKIAGAIDCDLHPAVPGMNVLLPYLDDYWREMVTVRALDRLNLSLTSYPQNAPLSCRPDWALDDGKKPGSSLEAMQDHVLDRYQSSHGILNCLYGAQVFHSEDMAAAFCRATNDWIRDEWLSRDPRLRASIVIPAHNTEMAVAEIDARGDDPNFTQILLLPRTDEPLGRRRYWPIFEAAVRNDLPITIHVGGTGGHPSTAGGWSSYYMEEHNMVAQAMQASLVFEGVFERFAKLRVVIMEGGLGWIRSLCARMDKNWSRMRSEVPQVKRPPSEYVREHVWFTTQLMEEPGSSAALLDLLRRLTKCRRESACW